MITEFKELCIICGKPATEVHHLIFGRGLRPLADKDGITAPVCSECHKAIHYNSTASRLSKLLGQLAWEKWWLTDFGDAELPAKQVREDFRERYGRSYL